MYLVNGTRATRSACVAFAATPIGQSALRVAIHWPYVFYSVVERQIGHLLYRKYHVSINHYSWTQNFRLFRISRTATFFSQNTVHFWQIAILVICCSWLIFTQTSINSNDASSVLNYLMHNILGSWKFFRYFLVNRINSLTMMKAILLECHVGALQMPYFPLTLSIDVCGVGHTCFVNVKSVVL